MKSTFFSAIKYAMLAAFACGIIHFALESKDRSYNLARERRLIMKEINYRTEYVKQREKTLDALANDSFYIERMLRERFGYKKPGEGETSMRRLASVGRDGRVARPRSR